MGNLKQFEIEMTKAAFQLMVLEAIAFAIGMVVLYMVIRYAIRDGINDSRLGNEWRATVNRSRTTTRDGDTMPPMHVD
ncbi:MAG: hypothetical protein ACK4NM_02460 [Hydrogenophaga sp.]